MKTQAIVAAVSENARPSLVLRAAFMALAVTVVLIAHAPIVALAARVVA